MSVFNAICKKKSQKHAMNLQVALKTELDWVIVISILFTCDIIIEKLTHNHHQFFINTTVYDDKSK